MSSYAQLTEQGVVHTVMETPNALETKATIVEIPVYNKKYLGSLWDSNIFRKLTLSCSKTNLVINESIDVSIQWVDIDGNLLDYGEDVELRCGEITEQVSVVNGRGATTFESAEPGEFELVAVSPHGVKASIKVVVS